MSARPYPKCFAFVASAVLLLLLRSNTSVEKIAIVGARELLRLRDSRGTEEFILSLTTFVHVESSLY